MKKFKITVDGIEYNVEVEEVREGAAASKRLAPVAAAPAQAPAAPTAPAAPARVPTAPEKRQEGPQTPAVARSLIAPMPGTVLRVLASVGDKVEHGQALVVLEAMKMENNINAPAPGTITSIEVSQGQAVDTGQLLLTIE